MSFVALAFIIPLAMVAVPFIEFFNDMAAQPKGKTQMTYGRVYGQQLLVERLPVAGVIQNRLGERTDKLASDIAKAAGTKAITQAMTKAGANPKALGAAAEHVGAAAREMKQAGGALSKSEPAKARMPHPPMPIR